MIEHSLILVQQLGINKQRKFGDVQLLKNNHGELFIKKNGDKSELTPRALAQLRNEHQYSFDHPNLPKIISTSEDDTSISCVFVYKNGIDLEDYWKQLSKKERLPFIKLLVEKLVAILKFIHSQNSYHCDIKPSNILIEKTDSDFNVHLIDFGMAINKTTDSYLDRELIFPLGFAAPEIILNRVDLVNKTTDYFALGISIYKLWTGQLPLAHANPSIFTNLQLAHPLPEHSKLSPSMYHFLAKLCAKPTWRTAPNLMSHEEVGQHLITSFGNRYLREEDLLHDLHAIKEKKNWFF